jgi:hypothetical protein
LPDIYENKRNYNFNKCCFVIGIVFLTANNAIPALGQEDNKFAVQATGKSIQDPLPGHESHQIVIAAPPRDDGKLYSGIATFTASQPIEVVSLHGYNATATDKEHGEPLNAPVGDGKVAISLMKKYTDFPVSAGSLPFAGSALAFHNLAGKPFTITYTIVGEVNQPTPIPTK